jgi:hypothetical protein
MDGSSSKESGLLTFHSLGLPDITEPSTSTSSTTVQNTPDGGTDRMISHNASSSGDGSCVGPSTAVKDLYSPDDESCLSELVCLLRAQLEVFAATSADVSERSSRKTGKQAAVVSGGGGGGGGGVPVNSPVPITPGRVGIRCKHCAHLPRSAKAKGAVSYPNSIRIMNQTVRNWQRKFGCCIL